MSDMLNPPEENGRRGAQRISLAIPAKAENMNVVRLCLAGIGERMGFSVDDIEDMKIVVGEACINSVYHGYQRDTSQANVIHIRFLIHATKLEILVEDSGQGFDSSRVNAYFGKPDSERMQGGGLGFYLMKTLADEVQISSSPDGTAARMVKYK